MLTFRRALVVAAVVVGLIFLIQSTHNSRNVLHSPKPTGSYTENKAIQNGPPQEPEPAAPEVQSQPSEERPPYDGDNGGRLALQRKPLTQIPLADLKAQPLRDQLEYAFPYDPFGKFPAIIWQTWRHSRATDDLEDELLGPEASWSENHPAFIHEVVTDENAVHLIRHLYAAIPEIVVAYEAMPAPILKADFFRYLILLARGGIYSDIDTIALKPAEDWVPIEVSRSSYGLVIGIEADPDREDWQQWYSRRIQFCQWTIQAKPGHPVLVDIVAAITQEALALKDAGNLYMNSIKSVIEFTGPALWTDIVFRFFNNPAYFDMSQNDDVIDWRNFTGITSAKKVGDVVVLPITSFSPGVGQMGAGEPDDPMAFVQHAFSGTWKPESERHIGEDAQ